MNKDKTLKKNNFSKFLKIYIAILIILTIIITIYVNATLRKYEENQVDNFMETVITDLKEYANKNEIGKHIDNVNIQKCEFERNDASVEDGLTQLLKSDAKFRFEINANSKDEINPIYDIYANDNKIFEIGLDGSNIETRLSLLTFSNWKVSYVNIEAENGLFEFECSVPNNYNVYVNDIELTEKEIAESSIDTGLAEISKYVQIPYLKKYVVKGFIEIPKYEIIDENGNAINEKDIKYDSDIKEFTNIDDVKSEISNLPNILQIAKEWSLFLSNDLNGNKNGFYNISEYLIKNSYLYNYAYKWATSIDITFISKHTLKNPTFTNERLTNFIIYNDKAFSCDVYLEKNMRISNGNDLTDTMNEKMYFAYYDDTNDGVNNPLWKLVNMQSLTNNK